MREINVELSRDSNVTFIILPCNSWQTLSLEEDIFRHGLVKQVIWLGLRNEFRTQLKCLVEQGIDGLFSDLLSLQQFKVH